MDLRRSVKAIIGTAAGLSGRYATDLRSSAVIVAFHRFDERIADDPIGCPPERFARFCRFFKSYFRTVPLSQLVADAAAGKDVGGTLAITLDDGYADNHRVAAPILLAAGLPATFFVTTGWIGGTSVAPWDQDLPVRVGWMDWDQVRALAAQGFEIGSHTHTHLDLGRADAATIAAELETSKRKFQDELGRPAKLFAYPFGNPENITDESRALVRQAGFQCCLSCYGGINDAGPSPFELRRIPVGAAWCKSPGQFGYELLQAERRQRRARVVRTAAA